MLRRGERGGRGKEGAGRERGVERGRWKRGKDGEIEKKEKRPDHLFVLCCVYTVLHLYTE